MASMVVKSGVCGAPDSVFLKGISRLNSLELQWLCLIAAVENRAAICLFLFRNCNFFWHNETIKYQIMFDIGLSAEMRPLRIFSTPLIPAQLKFENYQENRRLSICGYVCDFFSPEQMRAIDIARKSVGLVEMLSAKLKQKHLNRVGIIYETKLF
jgi:hypothetical protein